MTEYPKIKMGDIVVSKMNNSDVRFVEGADHKCILLVNGIQDKDYQLPEELDKFWAEWEILCLLEDRKDVASSFYYKINESHTSFMCSCCEKLSTGFEWDKETAIKLGLPAEDIASCEDSDNSCAFFYCPKCKEENQYCEMKKEK